MYSGHRPYPVPTVSGHYMALDDVSHHSINFEPLDDSSPLNQSHVETRQKNTGNWTHFREERGILDTR